jgi:hypothetical protein
MGDDLARGYVLHGYTRLDFSLTIIEHSFN